VALLPASELNTRLDQRMSISCALVLSLLADALPTAIEKTTAVVKPAIKSLLSLHIKHLPWRLYELYPLGVCYFLGSDSAAEAQKSPLQWGDLPVYYFAYTLSRP
jgi:hypothetical protein